MVCFLLLVFSFLLLVFSFLLLVFSFLLLTTPLISTQRCFRERVRVCVPVPVPVLEQVHSSLVVSDRMSYGDNLVPMLVLDTQDARTMPEYVKERREEWLIHRLQQISQDPPQGDLTIEYAYYDVDTTESATKPMVVHADAGYHRTFAECAAIAPGCM